MKKKSPETVIELLRSRCHDTSDTAVFFTLDDNNNWQGLSWRDYWSLVERVAAGLLDSGLKKGDTLAIILPVCVEWEIIDKAALLVGAITVGIEPHASATQISYILEHSRASLAIIENSAIVKNITATGSSFNSIIIFDDCCANTDCLPTWQSIVESNAVIPEWDYPSPSDHATLIYTSGTTGTPKGILYTHQQIMAAYSSILNAFNNIKPQDRGICWLPLANLFQRVMNLCSMGVGSSIYIISNPQQIGALAPTVNPAYFIGVPRFYEKLITGIYQRIDNLSKTQRTLMRWAIKKALHYSALATKKRISWHQLKFHAVLIRTLLSPLNKVMGSKIKFMITGSAPCPLWVSQFYQAIGIPLLEAYGMSENIIPLCCNRPDDYRFGSVGKPLNDNDIKISGDGEVWVKGPGVFNGYYRDKNPANNFTDRGYLKTGDFAYFDEDGFLYLNGRKNELIKTSTGRRISLLKIEAVLRGIPIIDQVLVVGEGEKVLTAIITLDSQIVARNEPQESSNNKPNLNLTPGIIDTITKNIQTASIGLASYEKICGYLILESLSIEDGEITANLKLRRRFIMEKYQQDISSLYQVLDGVRGSETLINNHSKVAVICQKQ